MQFLDANKKAEITKAFKRKQPFVIKNSGINSHGVSLDFLRQKYANHETNTFTPGCLSQQIRLGPMLDKIKSGEKYRLRSEPRLGKKLKKYFDRGYLKNLRLNQNSPLDFLLWLGGKNHTVFLSTQGCQMTKHNHITSGLIVQLDGKKTWYISNESFWETDYKRLYSYVFLTRKNKRLEYKVELEPGDILYIPSYWFHYTESDEVNLSFNYFFGEELRVYLRGFRRSFFLYDLLTKQMGLLRLVLSPAIEFAYGDKAEFTKTRDSAELAYLRQCDYS